ncbi:hypothetical protein M8J77_010052 [Diaphorina citri]|nr:hypothetical protein M8J77_010052 [Diaphorina citri]
MVRQKLLVIPSEKITEDCVKIDSDVSGYLVNHSPLSDSLKFASLVYTIKLGCTSNLLRVDSNILSSNVKPKPRPTRPNMFDPVIELVAAHREIREATNRIQ